MINFFKDKTELLLRNVVFGVEDSLVATVGLLSGVAVSGAPVSTVILTGITLNLVEGFSMAAGSFISEDSVQTYVARSKNSYLTSIIGAVIMFFSYFMAGFISLLPYVFIAPMHAFWISMALALIALFFLGVFSAEMFRAHYLRQGIKMLLIGGAAIAIGILAGRFVGGGY